MSVQRPNFSVLLVKKNFENYKKFHVEQMFTRYSMYKNILRTCLRIFCLAPRARRLSYRNEFNINQLYLLEVSNRK